MLFFEVTQSCSVVMICGQTTYNGSLVITNLATCSCSKLIYRGIIEKYCKIYDHMFNNINVGIFKPPVFKTCFDHTFFESLLWVLLPLCDDSFFYKVLKVLSQCLFSVQLLNIIIVTTSYILSHCTRELFRKKFQIKNL